MVDYDLVIVGGGSAGMAAAIQAKKDGIDSLIILEKEEQLGGILKQCIHNGFGLEEFKEELTGPEYLTRFVNQVKDLKIPYKTNANVCEITRDLKVKYCSKEGYNIIQAKAIIYATGCYERNAGAIELAGDRPYGVISAGTAQRWLNIEGYLVGKRIVILGSGDIGLIMARRLTCEGAKVLAVCEIMPYSNGLNRNIVQCLEDFNIPLYLSHGVKKVIGKSRVEKVIISKVDEKFNFIPNTDIEFDCDTLLLSVGLVPNVHLLNYIGVPTSSTKGMIVNNHFETMVDGIFTCGNCLHVHDLVDYVTNEGREAGHNAVLYIKNKLNHTEYISIRNKDNVNYCVPQFIDKSTKEDIILKFRVKKPCQDSNIIVENEKGIIKKIFKPVMIPSEMVMITLPYSLFKDKLDSDITIRIEAK